MQYFTYWNPDTEIWDFHQAPVREDGLRSRVYEEVRTSTQASRYDAEYYIEPGMVEVFYW